MYVEGGKFWSVEVNFFVCTAETHAKVEIHLANISFCRVSADGRFTHSFCWVSEDALGKGWRLSLYVKQTTVLPWANHGFTMCRVACRGLRTPGSRQTSWTHTFTIVPGWHVCRERLICHVFLPQARQIHTTMCVERLSWVICSETDFGSWRTWPNTTYTRFLVVLGGLVLASWQVVETSATTVQACESTIVTTVVSKCRRNGGIAQEYVPGPKRLQVCR
jgi:hypothetical protein